MREFRFVQPNGGSDAPEHSLQLEITPTGYRWQPAMGEAQEIVVLQVGGGQVIFQLNGQIVRAAVAREGDNWWVQIAGQSPLILTQPLPTWERRAATHGDEVLTAAMPSTVVAVMVNAGDTVEKNQPLVVLEAMKMETRLTAPHAGVVQQVHVQVGQGVDRGQPLVDISPLTDETA